VTSNFLYGLTNDSLVSNITGRSFLKRPNKLPKTITHYSTTTIWLQMP